MYPWESAGCYWSIIRGINKKAKDPGVHPNSISEMINPKEKNSANSSYGKRAKIYGKVCEYIKKTNY